MHPSHVRIGRDINRKGNERRRKKKKKKKHGWKVRVVLPYSILKQLHIVLRTLLYNMQTIHRTYQMLGCSRYFYLAAL